jgi:hypothetical protein
VESKLIEVRDRGTFIPALAIRVSGDDGYLARRAGFHSPLVILIHLETMECNYDPWNWRSPRTMPRAHRYIENCWNRLKSGDVVDVEFLLGETQAPKISEGIA